MSHLSILPTVLRDPELLAGSLVQLGFTPRFGGQLEGFAADAQPVLLQVELPEGGTWVGSGRPMAASPWWGICNGSAAPAACSACSRV